MGFIRDAVGNGVAETVEKSSGCAILFVCLLPFACAKMVIDARHENAEKAATEQVEMIRSCQTERSRSDDDAISQCRNAAALFGQDISGDMTRLSACLENHQRKIAQCSAKGL